MQFRNISAWCIRNPVAPVVLFVLLLVAGAVSFAGIQVNQEPDIDSPAVEVNVFQPGAAPAEMEMQVTQRIEGAIRGIEGVDEINSSIREGNSTTFVQFEIGVPADQTVNDVRNALAQIRSELPDGILEPQVVPVDMAGEPIFYAAAVATDMTLEQISWYVDTTVARRLLGVEGVAGVERVGGVDRQIRVVLDPVALQAHDATAAQINAQLRQSNLNATGGRAEIAGSEQSVRVIGSAADAYALSQIPIALPGGGSVKLADLGEVKDAHSEQRSIAKMNGRQVISFAVSRAKGASELTVYEAAWKELHKLEREDARVRYREIINNVDYTKSQYHSAMAALIEGAVLAVLVVFLFLRDIRATLISALAIPLSAIPALWFMSLIGLTLNGPSLLALSLVAGVLVDDAIVEIENIVRHMRMGKSGYQAAIDAADEIGLPVVATTMSIVAVFLPVALMPGIIGQYFKAFGFTVVIAVLMSLLVARMMTPLFAAYFLRAKGVEAHASGWAMARYMATLRWSLDQRKAHAYRELHAQLPRRSLAWLLDHRVWMVFAGFGAFILTGLLFASLSMMFQPPLDLGFARASVRMPPGATLKQTEAVVSRVAEIVRQDPDVDRVYERIAVGNAFLTVGLKKSRDQASTEFERKWTPQLAQIADAQVSFLSQRGGGPGSTSRDIMLFLGSDNPVLLEQTANKIAAEMEGLVELRAPRVAGDLERPEIVITPRFDLAADVGVTTAALSQTIRIATLGDIEQNSAKFSLADRQVPIVVSLSESARRDLATLMNLPVPTSDGGSVPLKSVAEISFGSGPTTIQRTNQVRRIAIGADLAPGLVSGDVWPKMNALPTVKNLPHGVSKLNLGDQKFQKELMRNFAIALGAGVLLVFAVLVLLYRHFLAPFVNMGSLLLAPLGAAIALHVTDNPVSLPVLIGILMLFGIVAKNSILLVDFAIEMISHGMPKEEAIAEAGHKRAQPIVMTTVAMVAGMLPIALSLAGDASWRGPMGITVMGGLIFSTVLTLLLVPAYFSLAIDIESWLGNHLSRLVGVGAHDVHGAPAPAIHTSN